MFKLPSLHEFLNGEIKEANTIIHEPKRPSGLAMDKLGLETNGGVKNIIAVYNQATSEEKEYWGKWYHNAKKDVEVLASHFNLPFPVMAAIVAVLSPGNRWKTNLTAAEKLCDNSARVNSYPRQVTRAREILKTGNVSLVTGPKVTVFFQSLSDPASVEKSMVLDGHAINIWRGEKPRLKDIGMPSIKQRQQMVDDYQMAADTLGVPVQAVQAVTWYIWKYTDKSAPISQPVGTFDVSQFVGIKPANDQTLDETNTIGSGAVVGYGGPLGMDTKPGKDILWSGDEPGSDHLEENLDRAKKLLLLVHPDVVFEMTTKSMQAYFKLLEDNFARFDYIITHLFYSDKFEPEWLSKDELKNHIFKNFIEMLRQHSNVIKFDNPRFQASFKEELPDFLIDNPGTKIFLAGGYESLCLKSTQDELESSLADIIKETNTELSIYRPLVIANRACDLSLQESFFPDASPDESYFYHATNVENAIGIKEEGALVPHAPDFGTDQDEWPDGSTKDRSYFGGSPKHVEPFYPEHGDPILLRVPRNAAKFREEQYTRDFYTTKPISASSFEFWDKALKTWKPLQEIDL